MAAGVRDTRTLSPAAQEDLRRRVVAAVLDGMTQVEAASVFRVSTQSVSAWMKTYRKHGAKGLAARRRGRRPEEQKALSARQQRKICRIVREHTPDRFGLDGFLWTRALVRDLITARCGVTLSLTTVGKYLRGWGLTWQKPVRIDQQGKWLMSGGVADLGFAEESSNPGG
jgi:transposase